MIPRRSTASITPVLTGNATLYGCGEEVGRRGIYLGATGLLNAACMSYRAQA